MIERCLGPDSIPFLCKTQWRVSFRGTAASLCRLYKGYRIKGMRFLLPYRPQIDSALSRDLI